MRLLIIPLPNDYSRSKCITFVIVVYVWLSSAVPPHWTIAYNTYTNRNRYMPKKYGSCRIRTYGAFSRPSAFRADTLNRSDKLPDNFQKLVLWRRPRVSVANKHCSTWWRLAFLSRSNRESNKLTIGDSGVGPLFPVYQTGIINRYTNLLKIRALLESNQPTLLNRQKY